jgi:pimeloyl-ACP methyl ester carboxylesterase
MRWPSLDGHNPLSCFSTGSATGRMSGAQSWQPGRAGPLDRYWRLICPGHGGSAPLPAEGYRTDELVRVVAIALQRLGLVAPIIVGHSLGARIALGLAASPCRPRLCVLVDLGSLPLQRWTRQSQNTSTPCGPVHRHAKRSSPLWRHACRSPIQTPWPLPYQGSPLQARSLGVRPPRVMPQRRSTIPCRSKPAHQAPAR